MGRPELDAATELVLETVLGDLELEVADGREDGLHVTDARSS